jgi:hypothetical protein
MISIETQIATARAITAITEVMTPEQRLAAAKALRALPGHDTDRRLFARMAATLEEFADADFGSPATSDPFADA